MRLGKSAWLFTLFLINAAACGSSPPDSSDGTPATMMPMPPDMPPQVPMPPQPSRGPYPVVLAHGFSGFRNIGPLDYFYGVKAALEADGRKVFVSQVEPYQSSLVRGEQLKQYIETVVLPQTGASRVNIIGHSQGGLDARYVASKLGNKIAAVVTVATPHQGTLVADVLWGDKPGPIADILAAVLNIVGGTDSDAKAAFRNLTSKGAADFNAMIKDHPDVSYFSVGGRSDRSQGTGICDTATEPAFVAKWDRYLDPIGAALSLTGNLLDGDSNPPIVNDGLVSVASSRWGVFLGCVPSDHLGEVCQLFGAPRGGGNPFTCVQFYRDLVQFLVERGL